VKRAAVWVVVVAGCWTSSKQPAPAPIANEVKQGPAATPGQAKQVAKTASGGVIQLAGERGAALINANEQMSQHCGSNNYAITQEGEEAVGSDAGPGQPVRIETAWRVHYVCYDRP
jgi:hypothetical protein